MQYYIKHYTILHGIRLGFHSSHLTSQPPPATAQVWSLSQFTGGSSIAPRGAAPPSWPPSLGHRPRSRRQRQRRRGHGCRPARWRMRTRPPSSPTPAALVTTTPVGAAPSRGPEARGSTDLGLGDAPAAPLPFDSSMSLLRWHPSPLLLRLDPTVRHSSALLRAYSSGSIG